MRTALTFVVAAAVVCLIASTCPAEGSDAKFVSMEVPETLVAGEVFRVKITFKNTGEAGWSDQIKLRSLDPLDTVRWGTHYIIIGQGKKVPAGGEFTFSSYLRAPAEPGEHVFQWQVAPLRRGEPFGEPTEVRKITVTPRPAGPKPVTQPEDPSAKHVLTFDDFEYVGSLKVPRRVRGKESDWAVSGLSLRRTADGEARLLIQCGVLYEAPIPQPVKLVDGDASALPTVEVKTVWGRIGLKKEGEPALSANAEFHFDPQSKRLYWSSYHGYWTGAPWPLLAATVRNDDGTLTHLGPWRVPKGVGYFKSYWGGVTSLPKSFADKHTGGRRLAVGFGGYYSICASTSQGPALAAVAEPDPAKGELDIVELLKHPWSGTPAVRDGDYFLTSTGWVGDQPTSPSRGTWTMDDSIQTGVFIETAKGHGFIVFPTLATGRIGYDYGSITSAGDADFWYVYDPADLGVVAKGEKKPWEIAPHSRQKVDYPPAAGERRRASPASVTGSCFDEQTGRLYLYKRFAVGNRWPIVHVYKVK